MYHIMPFVVLSIDNFYVYGISNIYLYLILSLLCHRNIFSYGTESSSLQTAEQEREFREAAGLQPAATNQDPDLTSP